jgi:hypothetical protein
MKKYKIGLGCIFTGLLLICNIVSVEAAEPNEIVTAYFQALKEGNVKVVKNLISGNLYNNRRVLLEENPDYGNFLKKIYMGSHIQIMDTVKKNGITYVDVKIEFQDGSNHLVTLLLKEDNSKKWKINEEIENP